MPATSAQVLVTLQIHFRLHIQCLHCNLTVQLPSYQKDLSSTTTVYHRTMSSPSLKSSNTTPAVTYAMSPGQAVQGLYDYLTNMGRKQWVEATKPLDDKTYDSSSKGLSHFLSKLSCKAGMG